MFHKKKKHVTVKYNFFRNVIEDVIEKVQKIPTSRNLVDTLAKVVMVHKFKQALTLLKVTR